MYPTNNQFGGARSRYRSSGRCIPRPQILRYEASLCHNPENPQTRYKKNNDTDIVQVMVKDAMNLDGVADEAGGSV